MISKKHTKVSTNLNDIEHFLILASAVTGCILISTFASLLGVSIGSTSSTIGTAEIYKCKSIIKKKTKKT